MHTAATTHHVCRVYRALQLCQSAKIVASSIRLGCMSLEDEIMEFRSTLQSITLLVGFILLNSTVACARCVLSSSHVGLAWDTPLKP
jgi:hypothetical protein